MQTDNTHPRHLPPSHLYTGELGDELVVLSKTEVRIAELATSSGVVQTADGPVRVEPGDFIVSMPSGERFPVKPDIYFGTYEVLNRVGNWHVGRRLLHPRRAWPIVSAGAEFDYGVGRGRVSATKGGWIYQSDDQDYGLINGDVNNTSHVVIGPAAKVRGVDWSARFRRLSFWLAALPPLLTAMALLALYVGEHFGHGELAQKAVFGLLLAEAALLAAGSVLVGLVRKWRWSLRAAFASGLAMAREFQVAVQALGQASSKDFPAMALWRAAQDDRQRPQMLQPQHLREVKDRIDEMYHHVEHEMHGHHKLEQLATWSSWVAAAVVLGCLAILIAADMHWLAMEHDAVKPLKLLAIGLPSVVGAIHAWAARRQIVQRTMASAVMLRELRFVRTQLVALAPQDTVDAADLPRRQEIAAALRMLCRSIAQYTQRELQLTAAEEVGVPV